MSMGQAWTLMRGDIVLGALTLNVVDMPFFDCHFSPTPAFEEVRPLFATELALLDDSEAVAAGTWDQAYRTIDALHLTLVGDDGQRLDDFLLHIEGDRAWFRY